MVAIFCISAQLPIWYLYLQLWFPSTEIAAIVMSRTRNHLLCYLIRQCQTAVSRGTITSTVTYVLTCKTYTWYLQHVT